MLLFRVYAEYLQDQLHRFAAHSHDSHSQTQCTGQAPTLRPGQVIPMEEGRFGKQLRDTFVEVTCKPVIIDLWEAEGCYLQEIPVVHDSTPFVDLGSQVLQAGGTYSTCLKDFHLSPRSDWVVEIASMGRTRCAHKSPDCGGRAQTPSVRSNHRAVQ